MKFDWKHYRQILESVGIRFLAWLIPLLSREQCVGLSEIIGRAAFYFDRKGRAVALANLEAVFGEQYSPDQRWEIALASFQNFARTMIDLFWAPRLLDPANQKYLKFSGGDNMPKNRERNAMVALSHKAGFEWTAHASAFNGFEGIVLTQGFKNPVVGEVFLHLRQIGGQKVITQEASMLRMLKGIKRCGIVGMLMDLNVMPTQASTIIDTFGMKMCVTILHAVVAQRTDAVIVPIETEPLPDGSTKVTMHPALDIPADASIQQIAQTCWNWLEPLIVAKPHLWMWTYKHWRFKPKGTTRKYPFYANESGRFEKLLKSLG